MSTIKIKSVSGSYECETCGFYCWETVDIFEDGVLKAHWHGDDHFGGLAEYNHLGLLEWALKSLGHSVEIEEKVDEVD